MSQVAKELAKEGRRSRGRGGGSAAAVRWGFKAPVTMYMIPFWAEVFPGATFVHVVREGGRGGTNNKKSTCRLLRPPVPICPLFPGPVLSL